MNKQPLVSILMTAYNRELYIAEAIESVLSQNYQNYELIIVDDFSSDRTVEIARTFELIDKRIKVYVNKQNIGQFPNRNLAASYAKGEYLKYVDSDDLIFPNTLDIMVSAMQTFPKAAVGFCMTHGNYKPPFPKYFDSVQVIKNHFTSGGFLFVGPTGMIFKKTAFESVKGFEDFGMPSDNHLSLKLASKFPVVGFENNLFIWREHEGQVFYQNKNNFYNIVNNYFYSSDIILNYSPLSKVENKQILNNLKKNISLHFFKIIFLKFRPLLAFKLFIKLFR
jgi:glycosyltransferase involved in cell wall biosynthesis